MSEAGADFPIAILGAGFSGIGCAIRLERAGLRDFTIFERAGAVGGTWRDNRYPGAACDVPSHVYSLSFEPFPDWGRKYAPAQEIWSYLDSLIEKWKLRSRLRLDTEIVGAEWEEASGSWTLRSQQGESFRARYVIAAIGGLVDPKRPRIEGLESYRGALFHTARWPADAALAGRRVAVIGTGASAVQVVPEVAREAERLHVFQRTPAWVLPRGDRAYSPRERRRFGRIPGLMRTSRFLHYASSELWGPMIYLDSPRLSGIAERTSLEHLDRQVRDPELRERLRPRFQFGCKRILISDDYWASFERENVELVDQPIAEITPTGLRTDDDREREVDAIVLATGFELGFTRAPFPIRGRDGRTLDEVWRDGARAYKGMHVAGFPNWSILMGPNTGPGHTSVLVYTEAQMEHTLRLIRFLRERGLASADVCPAALDRYDRGIQRRMGRMVWNSGCQSWYLSPDGRNRSLYPGPAFEYALRARRFRPRDFEMRTAGDARPGA